MRAVKSPTRNPPARPTAVTKTAKYPEEPSRLEISSQEIRKLARAKAAPAPATVVMRTTPAMGQNVMVSLLVIQWRMQTFRDWRSLAIYAVVHFKDVDADLALHITAAEQRLRVSARLQRLQRRR